MELPGGGKDLYILQSKYREAFAADVPARIASLLAATQRPISDAAFAQRSGPPAWKHVPSWSIYGSEDRAIAPPLMAYMAQRAGSKRTVVVPGGSHAVLASRADDVVALIEEAAAD